MPAQRHLMRRRLRTAALAAVLALGAGLGLAGCATDAGADTAEALHASVVRVAERSADEDFAGALAALLLLERDVDDAVAAGEVPAAQATEIRTAIELVRTDLQAADARANPTPTPSPTQAPADGDDGDGDGDGDDNSGPGNSGDNRNDGNNGNNGKGNGNNGEDED
ncbi:hypothetical protein [Agromyces sp. NPDC058064]|uniref:hypothetical protein n=1 Tax=Agromyces sp. NPDC058064 TaxID=3346322 RepID=UPI0036DC6F23